MQNDEPPEFLYHGTASKYLSSIIQFGIDAMSRQFVHLTTDQDLALDTGARHGEPTILVIYSKQMYQDGFVFHKINNVNWLTTSVPPIYINVEKKRQ